MALDGRPAGLLLFHQCQYPPAALPTTSLMYPPASLRQARTRAVALLPGIEVQVTARNLMESWPREGSASWAKTGACSVISRGPQLVQESVTVRTIEVFVTQSCGRGRDLSADSQHPG